MKAEFKSIREVTMLLFVCAVYYEAVPLIDCFGLKRLGDTSSFEIYISSDENTGLIVSGVGALRACNAVTYALTAKYGTGRERPTFVINVGSCAAKAEHRGKIFRVNKITDSATGYDYYPDILYKPHIPEKQLITSYHMVCRDEIENGADVLYDMESAGIYEAASPFLSPDRIVFLKCVSDCGSDTDITPEILTDSVKKNLETIRDVYGVLSEISAAGHESEALFNRTGSNTHTEALLGRTGSGAFTEALRIASQKICCTEAMTRELRQLFRYAAATGLCTDKIAEELPECTGKKEGRAVLDELRKKLI